MITSAHAHGQSHPGVSDMLDPVEAARRRLSRPATALIVMTSFQMVFVAIALVTAVFLRLQGTPCGVVILLDAGQFFCLLVIALGAKKMGFVESLALSRLAAFMACIPWVTPFLFLGIPFGIWALRLLNEPDIKAAFATAGRAQS